jgi:hypothetical protein
MRQFAVALLFLLSSTANAALFSRAGGLARLFSVIILCMLSVPSFGAVITSGGYQADTNAGVNSGSGWAWTYDRPPAQNTLDASIIASTTNHLGTPGPAASYSNAYASAENDSTTWISDGSQYINFALSADLSADSTAYCPPGAWYCYGGPGGKADAGLSSQTYFTVDTNTRFKVDIEGSLDGLSIYSGGEVRLWGGPGIDVDWVMGNSQLVYEGVLAPGSYGFLARMWATTYTVYAPNGGGVQGSSWSASVDANPYLISTLQLTAVPIPAAFWLFGGALAGLGLIRRRQANRIACTA